MRRTLLIALTALALLLVGCGTSGGDDATTSSKDGTTAPSSSDDTKDDEDEAPKKVTAAQLEDILPTAADVGAGYTVKESTDDDTSDTTDTTDPEDDPTTAALKEQCPKAAELDFLEEDDNADEVKVEFETKKDQGIEVTLDPTAGPVTEDNIDQVVEAFNDCGTVTLEDPDTGKMTMDLSAESLDGIGDFGAKINMDASFELFGAPIQIQFTGYIFSVDGVTVGVTASSGLDPNTFEPTPADTDLLEPLAQEMESRVKSLN